MTAISSGQATLTVTDGSGKGTCLVRVRGRHGHRHIYVCPGGGSTDPSGSTLTAGTAVVVNAGNGVRVRAQANTSSEILATLSNGDSVRVVQSAGNGWYQITFSGRRHNHHRLYDGRVFVQLLNIHYSDSSPDAVHSGGYFPIAAVGKSWYDADIGPPETDSTRKSGCTL